MNLQGRQLAVSARSFPDQELITSAWLAAGGLVRHVDRFWAPPPLDRQSTRLFGTLPYCIGLSSKLRLSLISPPEDFLLGLMSAYVSRRIWPTTLRAAATLSYPVFLKPMQPKLFRSAVYTCYQDLLFESCGISEHTELIASEIVAFSAEYRLYILRDQVVAYACYQGIPADQGMLWFARGLIRSCTLPEVFVLDLGLIAGKQWAVVEANPAWCASPRGCPPAEVVKCLAAATKHGREDP